jgi:Tfp pilus assembly protein PilP
MKRLTIMTMALTLAVLAGCKQTAEDRYQRYLDEVADSTTAIEFITPEKDPVAPRTNEGADPFADDGKGIYTIPEIPQEREVNMNANTYELEKMMQGRE